MERLKDPWVRTAVFFLFAVIVLVVTKRASPPTSLQSERPEAARSFTGDSHLVRDAKPYAWLSRKAAAEYVPLVQRIPTPDGFTRVEVARKGFADWLRYLPVAPPETPVTTGRRKVVLKADDPSLAAAIALQPTNDRALAGANMLIRIRAEYRWSAGQLDGLGFHFTSGHLASWKSWESGERPNVKGREVTFTKQFEPDASRENFCSYLETIFQYGTCYSLLDDTTAVADGSIAPGDLFLRTGKKPTTILVLDACTGPKGELAILLGEAGIPAQTFHVLKGTDGSPWFAVRQKAEIAVPGKRAALKLSELRRWK